MIKQEQIETILDRVDIVEVISQDVELTKKGVNYKGCCPFHKEKTPSFVVSPAKNMWHCFGACAEGGNAISYLMKKGMTYRDAIFELAKMTGVHIKEDKKELTAQEIQKQAKKESMLAINTAAAKFYSKQYKCDKSAQKYVESRWGNAFPQEVGIGYATKEWDNLYKHALKQSLSIDLMIECGLLKKSEKGKIYDTYRHRVMIPICDRYQKIIGFTARDMSGKKEAPKYINSSVSEIYDKSKTIFGLNIAIREGVKKDLFYLVEGAPDVMKLQSIGILNTVASLGTAWTEEQFRKLRKSASTLCFIPDGDVVKPGEPYGAGTKAVIRNGRNAIEAGFSVAVKELPRKDLTVKVDPDSFIQNKSQLKEIESKDYVVWYADIIFKEVNNTEETNTAIKEISDIIVIIDDEVKEDMYLTQLRRYATKNIWKKAINHVRKQRKADNAEKKSKNVDLNLLQRYGFYIDKNTYVGLDKDNNDYSWSNFIMEPLFHIKDSLLPKRLYRIKNNAGQEDIIELKQEDLVSLSKFKQRVEGLGNYIWLVSDKELTRLKMFLYEKTETAEEITQLGQHRKGFYAYGNGAYLDKWYPVDEYGIVRLPDIGNYYLPAFSRIYRDETKLFQFERKFVHLSYSAISFKQYTEQLIKVFGDNAKVGIAFLLATLFRDIITSYTKSFPILNLFGPKGSGKSELGHSLMSLFIIENTPPNIQNSTIAALADLVAQCANALVHIDEFKNNVDIDKREFLKGLWDGAGRSRMNMDRDKKREITSVDCGVILSGQEMATADIALFSRMIFLTFNKSEFTKEQKKDFEDLIQMRKQGLSHLVLQILQYRSKIEQEFKRSYASTMEDVTEQLKNERIEDRILRNWVIPLTTMRIMSNYLELPFNYLELKKITLEGIIKQNQECKSNNELANFWSVVSYLQQDGQIFDRADYRIDYETRFKSDVIKIEARYPEQRPILKLRKSRIFMLYKKFGKLVGDSVLPEGSLLYYLENSKCYMGKKKSVSFKNIQHGQVATIEQKTSTGGLEVRRARQVETALCFDYTQIMSDYDINLEVEPGE